MNKLKESADSINYVGGEAEGGVLYKLRFRSTVLRVYLIKSGFLHITLANLVRGSTVVFVIC